MRKMKGVNAEMYGIDTRMFIEQASAAGALFEEMVQRGKQTIRDLHSEHTGVVENDMGIFWMLECDQCKMSITMEF